jgi:hypothetical protein
VGLAVVGLAVGLTVGLEVGDGVAPVLVGLAVVGVGEVVGFAVGLGVAPIGVGLGVDGALVGVIVVGAARVFIQYRALLRFC